AAAAVLAGYGADGVLDRPVDTPYGTFPGAMVLAVGFADLLTHCWDLATAIGADLDVDDALADAAADAWEAFIQDDYRTTGMFGAVQPCPIDAPAIDRMVAFAGRVVPVAPR